MMETYRKEDIRRGDIYYADLRPVVGSEQGGIRPVVILQNNVGNRHRLYMRIADCPVSPLLFRWCW